MPLCARLAWNSLALAVALGLPCVATAHRAGPPPLFVAAGHPFTILEPATQLPAIVLMDTDDQPRVLATGSGRLRLLTFWAAWCAACRLELPLLEHTHAMMGDRVDISAVSVDAAESRPEVKAYLARAGVATLAIYLDPERRLAEWSSGSMKPFSPLSQLPVTYLITSSGRIAGYIAGVVDWLSPAGQRLLAYYRDVP